MQRFTRCWIAFIFGAMGSLPAAAQTSVEQRLDALQQEIDRLKEEVTRLRAEQAAPPVPATRQAESTRPAAATARTADTSIFGYGEFNYNRFRDADRTSRADLRRFVFGFGHNFNDRLSFNSEVEFEHGVVSNTDRGEAEIEQAYLNYQFSDKLNV